jgi:hypothetical protein
MNFVVTLPVRPARKQILDYPRGYHPKKRVSAKSIKRIRPKPIAILTIFIEIFTIRTSSKTASKITNNPVNPLMPIGIPSC